MKILNILVSILILTSLFLVLDTTSQVEAQSPGTCTGGYPPRVCEGEGFSQGDNAAEAEAKAESTCGTQKNNCASGYYGECRTLCISKGPKCAPRVNSLESKTCNAKCTPNVMVDGKLVELGPVGVGNTKSKIIYVCKAKGSTKLECNCVEVEKIGAQK